MATYTAQDALKAFMDSRKTTTPTVDLNYLIQREGLEIAAEQEQESNRIESEQQSADNNTARLNSIKDSLMALGYACDNSQSDWYKLYNKPKTYGANWQVQADYQISISTGWEYFCNHAYNIIYAPYQLNTWYDAGDTFIYSDGFLYEVIQGHTTQADWIPSELPALYKKAVLPDEIAD